MAFKTPREIAEFTVETGERKSRLPLSTMLILGFLGGAFISLGFLLDIRVIGTMPKEWGSFASFLGAAVFPLGLILVVLAGAELLTGNMMSVPMAAMMGKISVGRVIHNLVVITLANFVGAVFVAYCFGHVVGLTEGAFLAKTTAIAHAKIEESFVQAFVSAIGCNWLVGLAVWLAYGSDSLGGKILGIWFPIMGFVTIGFQHIVANMFVIPAAIFAGQATWGEFFVNFVPVFLGNLVGGVVFIALAYRMAYLRKA